MTPPLSAANTLRVFVQPGQHHVASLPIVGGRAIVSITTDQDVEARLDGASVFLLAGAVTVRDVPHMLTFRALERAAEVNMVVHYDGAEPSAVDQLGDLARDRRRDA